MRIIHADKYDAMKFLGKNAKDIVIKRSIYQFCLVIMILMFDNSENVIIWKAHMHFSCNY